MPTTFKKQLERRTEVQHELAIYEALYQYLDDTFIPRDGRSSEKAIRVEGCLTEIVPTSKIEEVLRELAEGPIERLREELQKIEGQPIDVEEPKTKKKEEGN